MDITRWSILKSDSLYSMQPKWSSFIQSAKTRPGTDCGSDHKLVIAKFRLKLKKVGKRLIGFCQENTLVIANTLFQQHKRTLYTWTSPYGQYQNQIDYIFCSQRWRSSIQAAKTRPGADCGSDHKLLITKFRLKLKKARKIIRPSGMI